MRAQQRHDIEDLVNQIVSSNFTKVTIKQLLINIREALPSSLFKTLRDLCDHVAHTKRDKGMICEYIKHFSLHMKFNAEFIKQKITLDAKSMPNYILDYLKLQLKNANKDNIKLELNKSIDAVKDMLDKHIKKDKKNHTLYISQSAPKKIYDVIKFLLKTYRIDYIFSQETFIEELTDYLYKENFLKEQELIIKQSDKITMCIILILHDSEYDVGKQFMIKESICHIASSYNRSNQKTYLAVNSFVSLKEVNENITFSLPIMKTRLESTLWCDPTLKIIESSGINNTCYNVGYMTRQPLELNKDFMLIAGGINYEYNPIFHRNHIYVDSEYGKDE